MKNVEEIPKWLHDLPVAPTYYPTDTEFADPIAYISKIEKEASGFGICKVVPPLPKPCKRFVLSNLNESLVKIPPDTATTTTAPSSSSSPVFTTRYQQLGCSSSSYSSSSSSSSSTKNRKAQAQTQTPTPHSSVVHKQVWQSGQLYTLDQFESKAKAFARTQLGGVIVTALAVEALFWNKASASQDPPIYIEYANDVPGSGFRQPTKTPTSQQTASSKLSNSPWNLQLIARSPGSLTRFMLDDIPGVTSPMIYIAMLFSWFAWHVEDHELHSLNFLHIGSPKTWYAVPGDYAFRFEEVIRAKAYRGNLDHLASLTLLGEKTNLVSPDVVISSGIPCCRLVQSPGEFVVTFPRAYHIGFSHGFNCGEAANFGTPQWLKVAKAAAVRRAAMDYLPMLSHQQLLYMLTMSFVSRVPKALLSGARTSRLKDRQKEERELRIKKACIDDMLNEKQLLSVLLGKESSFYAVLWDPDALPTPDCRSHEPTIISPMPLGRHCEGYQNGDVNSTRSLMETLHEYYKDEDDLPCGLHVDSGTLPCVACGVLGFPFMSIVQPSKKASEELFPGDCQVSQEIELGPKKSNARSSSYDAELKSSSDGHNFVQNQNISRTCRRDIAVKGNNVWKVHSEATSTSPGANETRNFEEIALLPYTPNVELKSSMIHCVDDHPLFVSKGQLLHSTKHSCIKWNTSNGFLRPRVFCLEHALQIEELLRSKGGANMLILCHSAYPKINAHALAVAEEIDAPFDSMEVPLECASKEDIDLITISMDGDGYEEGGDDWTARLGLNLRYCVKLRKLSPSHDEQHALALGGLFADTFFCLDHSSIKWKSRRTRTPSKISGRRPSKFRSSQNEKGDKSMEKMEKIDATIKNKILQYSRRKCNHKAGLPLQAHSEHHGPLGKHQHEDASTNNMVLDSHALKDTLSSIKNNGNDHLEQNHSSVLTSEMQKMNCTTEHAKRLNEIFYPPRSARSPSSDSPKNEVLWFAKSSPKDSSELPHDNCTHVETKEKIETSDAINSTDVTFNSTKDYSCELGWLPSVEPHYVSVAGGIREARDVSGDTIFVGSLNIPSSDLESMEVPLRGPNVEKMHEGNGAYHCVTVDGSKMWHKDIFADGRSELSGISDPAKFVGSYTPIGARTIKEDKNVACDDVVIDTSDMRVVHTTSPAICDATLHDFACSIAQPSSSMVENLESSMAPLNPASANNSELCVIQALEAADGWETCSFVRDTVPLVGSHPPTFNPQSAKRGRRKRRREVDQIIEEKSSCNGFIKSPCEGLRPRPSRQSTNVAGSDAGTMVRKKAKRSGGVVCKEKRVKDDGFHKCDIENCRLSFKTREQLTTHKRNRCTHRGCGKQFSSHKYALLHQRVHVDERPLKCPWKGCKMSFKWAWARTEHLRVHTGERPYRCKIEGCGLTFRFVSDFSRHRRKSGHHVELSS